MIILTVDYILQGVLVEFDDLYDLYLELCPGKHRFLEKELNELGGFGEQS